MKLTEYQQTVAKIVAENLRKSGAEITSESIMNEAIRYIKAQIEMSNQIQNADKETKNKFNQIIISML